MNPGIYYLYEYRSTEKLRNVGFLKLSMHYQTCEIQINARQIPVHQNDSLQLCVLFEQDTTNYAKAFQEITCSNNGISSKIMVSNTDLPEGTPLSAIHGFFLLSPGSTCYGAIEPDIDFDADAITIWVEAVRQLEQEIPVEEITSDAPEEELSTEKVLAEAIVPEEITPEEPETDAAPMEKSAEEDVKPEELIPEDVLAEAMASEDIPSQASATETASTPTEKIRKIQRSDISILPRKVWNIANNSFLLHGHHNYHHLLLVEEDGHYWLGVPGIFSPKEERAAELFGFPQFTNSYATYLDLSEDEKSDSEDFGHWCRYIR